MCYDFKWLIGIMGWDGIARDGMSVRTNQDYLMKAFDGYKRVTGLAYSQALEVSWCICFLSFFLFFVSSRLGCFGCHASSDGWVAGNGVILFFLLGFQISQGHGTVY